MPAPGEERAPAPGLPLHPAPLTTVLEWRLMSPSSVHLPSGKWAGRDCMLGMEFSGRDRSGRRVMGLVPAEGLATSVLISPDFLWDVPSSW